MENPKVRIESDGHITEVYINGKKVDRATMIDFHFHAEPHTVECEYEKYKSDENGHLIVENDEIVKEQHILIFDKE